MTGPRFKLIESQYPPGCEEAEEITFPADQPSPSVESPEEQLVSMTGEIEYKILKKELLLLRTCESCSITVNVFPELLNAAESARLNQFS